MTYTSLNTLFVERRSITMWANEPGYPDQVNPPNYSAFVLFSVRGTNLNLTYTSLNGLLVERRGITMWADEPGYADQVPPSLFAFSPAVCLKTLAPNLTHTGLTNGLLVERRSITMWADEAASLNQVLRYSLLDFFISVLGRSALGPNMPYRSLGTRSFRSPAAYDWNHLRTCLRPWFSFGAVHKTLIDLESAKMGRTKDAI
jgi:hypothetical protein